MPRGGYHFTGHITDGIRIPNYRRGISTRFSDTLDNLRTAGLPPSYSYVSPPSQDSNSDINGVGDLMNGLGNSLDSAVSGFGSGGAFANATSSFTRSSNTAGSGNNADGSESRGGLIMQLIGIIQSVLTIPMRFMNAFQALTNAGIALGLGAEGLGESAVLGIKDILILIVAILKVFFKYLKCIISFVLTTVFGGCFIPHVITFLFYVLYLIFPVTAFMVYSASGFDLEPYIDAFFEMIHSYDDSLVEAGTMPFHVTRWPDWINMWCYMCFFEEVHLKDVLDDVMVVKQIGDLITHDFNVTMPRYMRPAMGPAVSAKQHLDAAME
jgi:hypothetical protein